MEREKKFNIGDKTFIAKFPNVGQMIDIESLKQALTNNRYGIMAASGISSMYDALDIVDAVAFLKVCVPSVSKFYNIDNYMALQIDVVKDFVDVYKKELKPWYDNLISELKGISLNNGSGSSEGKE
jgi:hypothetical protein